MKSGLKRLFCRFTGNGPIGTQPFDTLYPDTGEAREGVHQAEGFNGVLATAAADACLYGPSPALLGQQPEPEFLPDGPRFRARGLCPSPVRRLFSLTDACVAGDDGVVSCPRRRLAVLETVRQWDRPAASHPLFSSPGFPAAEPLPGLTLSLAGLGAQGFYHFLIESLPRLDLAQPWLAALDHVLVPGQAGGFHEAWLALAGIPCEKIIWLQGLSHHRCAQVLFTNQLSYDSQPTPWLVGAIHRALGFRAGDRGGRRLWISRGDAGSRHLSWEDALLARLGNFERVELARLAPAAQISLLREAAAVAGPHGAGLANLVFCSPGTRVVELMPDLRHRPLFGRLAAAADCRHAWAAVDFGKEPENLGSLAEAIRRFAA